MKTKTGERERLRREKEMWRRGSGAAALGGGGGGDGFLSRFSGQQVRVRHGQRLGQLWSTTSVQNFGSDGFGSAVLASPVQSNWSALEAVRVNSVNSVSLTWSTRLALVNTAS
ncbi:uncharacterized protein LOC110935026 [Helianthus annuus]|uniref:uncharacterized protein LOC110935026 n=1 Tax=Helianthus annuus TaxID=4232 RepID=UPI000B9014A6|nr:uncharacterized protein LOC110935026 [Helianthus annuus]